MSFDRALFGPAGNSISFAEMGYRNSLDTPKYLEKMGLDWFEYQCGRGVNIGAETCKKFGEVMKAANKGVSLHAPYYISLSSTEEVKRDNSVTYILRSA